MLELFPIKDWHAVPDLATQQQAIAALENGKVVYLPSLPFNIEKHEEFLLIPDVCAGGRKNVSYDIKRDQISNINRTLDQNNALKNLMQRYAIYSRKLLNNLFPQYNSVAIQARTSYRPVEIAGRVAPSYRKDDTMLHVDAFPATPVQGTRILRIFSNVNPHGQARVWRVGEDFNSVASKFVPQVKKTVPGLARVQQLLKITRGYRTMYDHYMLNIHNAMKADQHYQKNVTQQTIHFPPGSTWCVYTDQVSHAAMAGQYVFEQTFYLPLQALENERTAPLRVLETLLNKQLV